MSDKLTEEFSKLATSEEKVVEETKSNALPSDAIDLLFQASQRVSIEQALADRAAANRMDVDDTEVRQPARKPLKESDEVQLFSFVDAGGYQTEHDSGTSVSTIMWVEQRAVLVGSASANLPDIADCERFLQTYFWRLHRMYLRAVHVIMVEQNNGRFNAAAVHESVRRILPRAIKFCERPPIAGTSTTSQQRCNAMLGFSDRIRSSDLRVAREEDFVTDGDQFAESGKGNVLNELKDQLKRMKQTDTQNEIPVFSGKGESGSGLRDDGYLTWSAAILWSRLFLERAVLMREVQSLGKEFLRETKDL